MAILAVLLAVTQTPVPAFGQASNNSASTGGSVLHDGKQQQTPAAPPIPAANPAASPENHSSTGNEGGNNTTPTVSVRELPAVSISKDWADKSYWLFSGLLVLVGAFQVVLLWRTLRKISDQETRMGEQVAEMRTQATHMSGQLEEMKKAREIENKTLILQYRPKIIVRNATVKSFSKEIGEGVFAEPIRCIVAFQIGNIGGSPAHIIDGDIYLLSARSIVLGEEIAFKESTHIGIGQRTLQPGERETIECALNTGIPNDAQWTELYKGVSSHSIFLLGTIWYRDDLDIPRQTGLHRSYDPKTKTFVPRKDSEEEYSD